jgi:hypothetical protein
MVAAPSRLSAHHRLQTNLLHQVEQFERRTRRALLTNFPFLNR